MTYEDLEFKYSPGDTPCELCRSLSKERSDWDGKIICNDRRVAEEADALAGTDAFVLEFVENGNVEILEPRVEYGVCNFFRRKSAPESKPKPGSENGLGGRPRDDNPIGQIFGGE